MLHTEGVMLEECLVWPIWRTDTVQPTCGYSYRIEGALESTIYIFIIILRQNITDPHLESEQDCVEARVYDV